ncbi:MAG TPA: DUF4157 domain-containing protein [Opitutaceae bacterium]|nr:DUF4157 domain-containing protein [Opitutaceae bacterium]
MKAAAHARRSSAKPGASRAAAAPRVQAKARPGGMANHRRQGRDSFERQADEIASRIMRGEKTIGQRIMPAAAAGFRPMNSTGARLPRSLREEMEAALGADLGAVRVHTGGPANEAACHHEAEAFASGRDVYFRAGRFAPHTTDGRQLIAHELVHVLQQTGRRHADGRLHATPAAGSGELQFARTSRLESSATLPTFEAMAARHSAAAPADKTLAATIKQITGERDTAVAQNNVAGYWERLETQVTGTSTYSALSSGRNVRAFIFDTLKLAERWKGAVTLLAEDNALKTTFFAKQVYENFPEGNDLAGRSHDTFLRNTWENDPALEAFRPQRFLNTYIEYFFGPTRSILNLNNNFEPKKPETDFQKIAEAKLAERDAPAALIQNELFFIAVDAIRLADKRRVTHLIELAGKRGPKKSADQLTPEERAKVAGDVSEWAKKVSMDATQAGTGSPEGDALFSAYADAIVIIGSAAVTFWSLILPFIRSRESGDTGTGWTDARIALDKLAASHGGVALKEELWYNSMRLFRLDPAGNPQSPEEYLAARDAFAAAIQNRIKVSLEPELIRLWMPALQLTTFTAPQATTEKDRLRLADTLALGWTITRLGELLAALAEYTPEEDARIQAEYAKLDPTNTNPAADVRIRNRLRVATFVEAVAAPLGWESVVKNAYEAKIVPDSQKKSLLAIFGPWEKDGPAGYDLTVDFKDDVFLTGLAPLTAREVVDFFELERFRTIADFLRKELDAEAKEPGSKKEGMVDRAMVNAEEMEKQTGMPTRWVNRDVSQSPRDADLKRFDLVVTQHPKVKGFIDSQKQVDPLTGAPIEAAWIVPRPIAWGMVLIWILPPMNRLIARFQTIPSMNKLVYRLVETKAGRTPDPAADLTPIATMDWYAWWTLFLEATSSPDFRKDAELADKVGRDAESEKMKVGQEWITEFVRMQLALTEASNFDRRKVADHLNEVLGDYDRFDEISKSTKISGYRYQIPDYALRKITRTVAHTLPREEQTLHETALMLEIAETLAGTTDSPGKFVPLATVSKITGLSPRPDVVAAYLPLMEAAAAAAVELSAADPDMLRLVLKPEQDKAWVLARAAMLTDLAGKFHAAQILTQSQVGLEAVAGSESYLGSIGMGQVLHPPDPFTIDGVDYELVAIKTSFIYHPRHGTEKAIVTDREGTPIDPSVPLLDVKFSKTGKTIALTGGPQHEQLLEQFSIAVTWISLTRSLDELGEFMKGATELTMDLIELIPGPGQVLMAARLAIGILQFVGSDEFDEILKLVAKDPIGEIEKVAIEIGKLARPDLLWDSLLFGNNPFDRLHSGGKPKVQPKMPKNATAQLARVVGRMYGFGKGFAGAVGRLQTKTRWQVETAEVFVLSHPVLAWILRMIADHMDEVIGKTGELVGKLAPADRDAKLSSTFGVPDLAEYKVSLERAMTEWPGKVIELVDVISKMELPEEIIPTSDLIEIAVSLVLQRLPLKFKIASLVIMFLLEKFDKKKALFDAAAEQLKQAGLDPNKPWQDLKAKHIEEPFRLARNQLAETLLTLMASVVLFSDEHRKQFEAAKTPTEPGAFKVTPGEMPDVTPYATGARRPTSARLPSEPGQPLPRSLRAPAERGFGQGFGHVRLHTGPAARAFTQASGAEALTGGSHVFLGASARPSTPRGNWILNHELAHVVQQTGPRPLGRAHSLSPVPVPRGRGLTVNPASESAASHAADALKSGRSTRVSGRSTAGAGLQPFGLIDVTRKLLDTLAGTTDLEKDEAKEEKSGAGTGSKALPKNIKSQVDELWMGFEKALEGAAYTSPFDQVKKEIVANLKSKVRSATESGAGQAIQDALGDLANDSAEEKKIPGKKKTEPEKITYVLNVDRFEIALSRFIFAASGVLIRFKLKEGVDEKTAPTFRSLQVVYVHLAELHGGTSLWQKAINPTVWKSVFGADDTGKFLPRVRSVIAARGPGIGIWDSSTYQLKTSFLDEVKKIIDASQGALPKDQLPPPLEYLAGDLSTHNIGLRLGVYGDATQQGTERESHHITQYLLLEYFRNKCEGAYKPFPLLQAQPTVYPGVTGSGGLVDTVTAKSAPKPIKVREWEAGRGENMPAILLATPTHRTGRLHVTTKADDWTQGGNKATAVDSPASVVNLKFHEALNSHDASYLNAQTENGGAGFGAYVARTNSKTPGAVQETIYSAMQDTYHWMRGFMQPRLQAALLTAEMKYYNELGKDKGLAITAGELSHVFNMAVGKNGQEMEKGGWN